MTHYRDLKQHTHEVSRGISVLLRPSRRPGQNKQADPLRSSPRACDPRRSTLEDPRATIASPSRFAVARAVTRRDSRRDGNHRPGRSVNSIYRDVQHEAADGHSGAPRPPRGPAPRRSGAERNVVAK